MVGPFKKARGSMTHLLVAVDKFTEWVEAKPIAKCDGATATRFLKELIYRYGYPTASSPTTAPTSLWGRWPSSAETGAYDSTSRQSHTPNPMAKPSALTRACWRG